MKKTLALLIAVLMVVAMLPLSILTVGAEDPAPSGDDMFAVYDDTGALVDYYTTLADADAALANDYTLKLLHSYNATETYAWGAARADDATSINFTIDGNDCGISYEGEGCIWSFGVNCAGDQITLTGDVMMMTEGGADVITVSDGAVLKIESGMFMSDGRAVVRTVKGASADTRATLAIYGGQFMLASAADVLNTDAVVTNGDAGNVYIYGGIFMNDRDTQVGTTRSDYVLRQTNAAGDFKIYAGVMMATGMQKGFYRPADGLATGSGVSLPTAKLPIVKGVTPVQVLDGREYYYTVYGAAVGDALLVPTISPAVRPLLAQGGNALVFVTNLDADLLAAIETWARGKASEAGVDPDAPNAWDVKFGTIITEENIFISLGASIDNLLLSGNYEEVIADTDEEIVDKGNGDFELLAVSPAVTTDMKEMRAVAITFIELVIDGTPQRFYGEFNMTSVASMASVAANALRDNAAEAIGDYQYPSITVAQAFSRYTEAEQQTLMEYLAHEHEFNFCGDCITEGCTENVCDTLDEMFPAFFYTENGSKTFYEIELEAGVRYAIGLSDANLASYELYDANGNACTVTNDTFTPAADGTYYVCVNGEKTGSCVVAFSHIHNTNYLGECDVCEEDVSAAATVEANNNWVAVKGNSYVLRVDLAADVVYAMRSINSSFTLYNADGELQSVVNNTFIAPEDGTYYITVLAGYTGTVTMQIAHIHQYDYTGLCAHCGDNLGVQLNNVYTYSDAQRVKIGDQLYMSINLEEGNTYKIAANGYVGTFKLYDAAGVEQTLNGSTFVCTTGGIYYLKVNVQAVTTAQIRFEVEHGTNCTYNNKGECEFMHVNYAGTSENVTCGKTNRTRISDAASKLVTVNPGTKSYLFLNYASKNVTYHISISGAVTSTFYNASGAPLVMEGTTEDGVTTYTYTSSSDADLYLVLENTGAAAVVSTIAVTHDHVIDYRGQCTVKNTTTGSTPSACKERQVAPITEINKPLNVTYTADGIYRYSVTLSAGVEYRVAFENADVTWELRKVDGSATGLLVYSSDSLEDCYIPAAMETYYLVVTATADSTGTDQDPATLTITSHSHTFNNKGECNGASCGETYNKKVLVADTTYNTYLAADTHYFHVDMEEGYSYKLTFTADGVTYKLYGGANADVEQTLTDGVFTCTESGTYYYVVTVTEDIPTTESYKVVAEATVNG